MKQIATVIRPIEQRETFDNEVNALLAEGWKLTKRSDIALPGTPSEAFNISYSPALKAELEREVPPWPEEITT